MNIVFIKSHHYDSYTDFWKLVELSGFEVRGLSGLNLDEEGTLFVVTPVTGDFRPHMQHRRTTQEKKCKVVWWNLERPDTDTGPSLDETYDDMLTYVDEIWVSDRHYATLANGRAKFVILGSHPGLAELPRNEASLQYDWAHMSAYGGRRNWAYARLKEADLREGPNGWGLEKAQTLSRSRCMLSVRQNTKAMPIGEPIRFALAAAYRIPLISEELRDPYPLVARHDFVDTAITDVVPTVRTVTSNNASSQYGERLFQKLCIEHPFRKEIELATTA